MKLKQAALALFVLPTLGFSAVTITAGNIGKLLTAGGQTITADSIGILVADFSNNGLVNAGNTTLTVNSFIGGASGGSDDQILGVFKAVDLSGSGDVGFDFSGVSFSYSGSFGSGDNLYFLWFPTVSTDGTTLGGGLQYGAFRSDSKDISADVAWIAAPDGQNVSIIALDGNLGGSPAFTPAQFTASLVTVAVPEPSTYAAIAGLAVLGVVASRRRRSA